MHPINEETAAKTPPTWPVFRKGEVVEVKGGRFRISYVAKRKIILKGVPMETPLGREGR